MNRLRSESSMRRLIMNDRPRAHVSARTLGPSRQYGGGTHGYCRDLDQEDGEENVLRDLTDGKRHVRAPRVERCGRRQDRRQGRERAGHQRRGQRKGEGRCGRRRVVRVGRRAAAVCLGLSDDSLRACARLGGSVHRAVAAARAAGHARLRRGLPARALGPSRGAERESDDERRRASEQQSTICRMHGATRVSMRWGQVENVAHRYSSPW